MDSVTCGDRLDLLHSPLRDVASSLRKGFESPLKSKRQSLQKASMQHVREWVTIEDPVDVGFAGHACCHLPQSSEEYSGTAGTGREILRITGVADDRARGDAGDEERRRGQTRRADNNTGLDGQMLEVHRDIDSCAIAPQFDCEGMQTFAVACVEKSSPDQRSHTPRAAGAHIARRAHDQQGRGPQISSFHRAHLLDALNDEGDSQGVASGEDGASLFRQLIEVALDKDGTEATEADDLRSCVDGGGRCPADADKVVAKEGCVEVIGWNKRVDVEAVSSGAENRSSLDVADRPGRNPRKDVPDLIVGNR